MMHWGEYGWGMGFGWLFMIIFWLLAAVGIVSIVRMISEKSRPSEKNETSLDILKKRYAKGEISREDFEKMKSDLKKD